MKEKDITPEVIRLSKEIAELWRMEIYEGCWYLSKSEKPYLVKYVKEDSRWIESEKIVLIPSVSDCLGKFKNLELWVVVNFSVHPENYRVIAGKGMGMEELRKTGKTPLEALLSALLEVLKNE